MQKNYKQAFNWHLKAALKGDPYSAYYLGISFQNGFGVNIDYDKAIKWYKKSAEQGLIDSQYNLAVLYYTNQSYFSNLIKSYAWMLVASKGNYKPAILDLKSLEKELSVEEKEQGRIISESLATNLPPNTRSQQMYLRDEFGYKISPFFTIPFELISRLDFRKQLISETREKPQVRPLYTEITLSLANLLEHKSWQRIVVNMELENSGKNPPSTDTLAIYVGENMATRSFFVDKLAIPEQTENLMIGLNELSNTHLDKRWDVCEWILDSNGRYQLSFSNQGVKRLKGVYDEESSNKYGNKYLDEYIRDAIIYRKF